MVLTEPICSYRGLMCPFCVNQKNCYPTTYTTNTTNALNIHYNAPQIPQFTPKQEDKP